MNGPVDPFLEAFLSGQRELAEFDVDAAVRKIPPPPGLRSYDPGLQRVVEAAANAAETDIRQRTIPVTAQPVVDPGFERPANGAPVFEPAASRWRENLRWAVVGFAAAAVMLLTIGLTGSRFVEREHATPTLESASQLVDRSPSARPFQRTELSQRRRRPHRRRVTADNVAPKLPRTTAPLEPNASEAGLSTRSDRFATLERRARQQLANGDLEGARRSFRKLARRGGRSSRAELAYGELFALARRSGSGRAQAELWKAYLRKFPRGRFADDARAGLCRRAPTAAKDRCWNRYVEDFPSGSHRSRARRELEEGRSE